MFARLTAFASVVAFLGAVSADPQPLTPDGSVIFKEGGDCIIKWGADTTGVWKEMNIQFMTGDNYEMKHLTTVGKVDATTTTSYTWTCPDVNPYSKIYFYQFSTPANTTLRAWTTRFAISDKDGNTTPPEHDTQPAVADAPGGGADAIAWGSGALADPSTAVPAPSYIDSGDSASNAASNSVSVSASSSGSASATGSATASASSGMATKSASASGSKSASGTLSGTAAPSGSAAAGDTSGAMSVRATSMVALGAVFAALGLAM